MSDQDSGRPGGLSSQATEPEVSALRASIPDACRNCGGGAWVCENHQDRPWDGTSARADACGCGAGAPCPICWPEGADTGALRTILRVILGGHWTANVFHNPPVRGRPSNTNFLKAATIRVEGKFDSADQAFTAAAAVIEAGRPSIGTFIHRPTAKALAHYNLSAEQVDQLGSLAQAIEARRAETGTGSVHESAVGNADAPNGGPHAD